eukprot:1570646-Pyramimonas_sp.AAC.1
MRRPPARHACSSSEAAHARHCAGSLRASAGEDDPTFYWSSLMFWSHITRAMWLDGWVRWHVARALQTAGLHAKQQALLQRGWCGGKRYVIYW